MLYSLRIRNDGTAVLSVPAPEPETLDHAAAMTKAAGLIASGHQVNVTYEKARKAKAVRVVEITDADREKAAEFINAVESLEKEHGYASAQATAELLGLATGRELRSHLACVRKVYQGDQPFNKTNKPGEGTRYTLKN